MSSSSSDEAALLQSLTEVLQKVEASLQPKIEDHVAQQQHPADHASSNSNHQAGLDFLDTKNSLLLSYLIELTYHLRGRLLQQQQPQSEETPAAAATAAVSWHRLTVMRTALDKLRALDQKLRYQIDKLLAHGSAASTAFAQHHDPLQFRPAAAVESGGDSEKDNDDDNSSSSSSEDDEASNPKKASGNKNEAEDDIDEDLAAARRTMALAKQKNKDKHRHRDHHHQQQQQDDDHHSEPQGAVYRAPRFTAVPYTHDRADPAAARERRHRERLRASEVATTLRQEYGETPEQEGGSSALFHSQRAAARKFALQEQQRTAFEEDHMVRLATSRSEKKERKRLQRQEASNLAAISDLGSLARDSNLKQPSSARRDRARHPRDDHRDAYEDDLGGDRHANGKRRRQQDHVDGRQPRPPKAYKTNALQEALFGGGGGDGKKKKRSKR